MASGRGPGASHCVLMVGDEGVGPEARERLAVMAETGDGFRIAERDLEIRGPGAVFGTQQHGLSDLQFLSVVLRDPALLEAAREEARRLAEGKGGADRARRTLDSLRPGWKRRLSLAGIG